MKKLFFSMFVAVVTLTLWSCGNANTPSAVAEKAVKCIQKADYEGYVDLMNLKKQTKGTMKKNNLWHCCVRKAPRPWKRNKA